MVHRDPRELNIYRVLMFAIGELEQAAVSVAVLSFARALQV